MGFSASDPFQESLWADDLLGNATVNLVKPHQPDGRSIIGAGVAFSRRFILSYNVVLLIILLGCTLYHWIDRSLRVRRRSEGLVVQQDDSLAYSPNQPRAGTSTTHTPLGSSSSSSSSTSLETPPGRAKERGHADESTALLPRRHPPSSRLYVRGLSSWLMYQPANIPIINKTLPSNATSVAVLLFLGLNVFYLVYRVPLSLPYSFVLADRAGLLFVANLPILYLFAAKNQPIKWLTGRSYETLNIIHRRLGEWMCFIALIHLLGMLATWYILLSARLSFSRFIAIKLIWLGLATFFSYEMLYLTSLESFRQRFYELFLALHVFFQASALGFLFFHHPATRPYVGIALAIFLIDRIVFRIALKTRTIKADLSILEDGETILVASNWALSSSSTSWWRRRLDIHAGWKPTEHVFLSVPALSKKHIIQAHPFTIASAAPRSATSDANDDDHAWLNLVIRAQDGFSRDLLVHAQSHRSVSVRIDGPYGSLHAREMLRDSDHAVIIAGGSGIAVAHPLVWDLLPRTTTTGRQSQARRVTLIWVVHDHSHLDWIGRDRLDDLRARGLNLVLPPPTLKAGRPDVQSLLLEACSAGLEAGCSATGVVVSGPDSMNRSARNTCAGLVRQGLDVKVSIEKFGW